MIRKQDIMFTQCLKTYKAMQCTIHAHYQECAPLPSEFKFKRNLLFQIEMNLIYLNTGTSKVFSHQSSLNVNTE